MSQALKNLCICWELIENNVEGEKRFKAAFTFKNVGSEPIKGGSWKLYFNQTCRKLLKGSRNKLFSIALIRGDFYEVTTHDDLLLEAGECEVLVYEGGLWLTRYSDAPSRPYYVIDGASDRDEEISYVHQYEVKPFKHPKQIHRTGEDAVEIPSAETTYNTNKNVFSLADGHFSKVIPTPVELSYVDQTVDLGRICRIQASDELLNEANFLALQMKNWFDLSMEVTSIRNCQEDCILLSILRDGVENDEGYEIECSKKNTIRIRGTTCTGVFYGIQTVISHIATTKGNHEMVGFKCRDYPRYGYRGVMIDVARNFHSKSKLFRLIDVMAMYKLNKLHIHLTDDEGWRIEIESLPELTAYGARRGHTLLETEHLQPSFGSGPTHDNEFGSGYYSKQEFVEILKYAKSRHIEVVPEINVPGHARAAIKAMQYRYEKYWKEGDIESAEEFMLSDPGDTSQYESVQLYNDNVVCVGRESVYKFYAQVVDAIIGMYEEADAKLSTIHTGGDEVPSGVWESSPICEKLKNTVDGLKCANDLRTYFTRRISEILRDRGLVVGGWEEVGMKKVDKRNYIAHPEFKNQNFLLYAWRNLSGYEDLAYKMANGGFNVVLCNATHLYFDLCYNKHPDERGLYWAGFIDTRKVFSFSPENMVASCTHDLMGNRRNVDIDMANHTRINSESVDNIKGLQGELWGETIVNEELLEYYLLPRMIALSERCWTRKPEWETLQDVKLREELLACDWNKLANSLGKYELYKLGKIGCGYRVPPPGAIVKDRKLHANVSYPGLKVRYTTDGTDAGEQSRIYSQPVPVSGSISLIAFDDSGNSSRTCIINT